MVDSKNEMLEPRESFLCNLPSHQSLISDGDIGQSEPVHEGADDVFKYSGPVLHFFRIEGHEKMGQILIGKVSFFEFESFPDFQGVEELGAVFSDENVLDLVFIEVVVVDQVVDFRAGG